MQSLQTPYPINVSRASITSGVKRIPGRVASSHIPSLSLLEGIARVCAAPAMAWKRDDEHKITAYLDERPILYSRLVISVYSLRSQLIKWESISRYVK